MRNTEIVQYVGYALQLLLVLVLVISLAVKSWALLGVCLGAALVLLVLVCIQLLGTKFPKNAKLMKRSTMNQNHSEYIASMQHPNFPVYMEPNLVQKPMAPAPYTPPIYAQKQLTSDEKTALQIMTMTDRGVDIHAPVLPMHNQRIVAVDMGLDPNMQLNSYQMPVKNHQTPLLPHMDPSHPDNPMNSLSYLYS